VESLWKGLVSGESRIRIIERFDTSKMRSHLGALVGPHDPRRVIRRPRCGGSMPTPAISILAAAEALEAARLEARERAGVVLGTNSAGVQRSRSSWGTIHAGGRRGRSADPVPLHGRQRAGEPGCAAPEFCADRT
jgi:3-oxoacyl-(acyl-carrier-protein) synthase